ncbi:MAG TPA: thioredoxin family protein [Anaerovoracaceae bacterium]|nr:thioredoxin family protein [Anaerovoracaceae bacterium]
MGIFNFGIKTENAEDAVTLKKTDVEKANYIVLGACCKKSAATFENTKTALKKMGIKEDVLNIGDSMEIAKYGVMQTPALVINNKVVSYGKLLKVEDVIKLIEKARVL